jgi:hypothetical protein
MPNSNGDAPKRRIGGKTKSAAEPEWPAKMVFSGHTELAPGKYRLIPEGQPATSGG